MWRPISFNDEENKYNEQNRDRLDYHSTQRSFRWDWKLQQKFAYVKVDSDDEIGYWKMAIGAVYERKDGSLICVKDVINTGGSQLIKYFSVLKFSICFTIDDTTANPINDPTTDPTTDLTNAQNVYSNF